MGCDKIGALKKPRSAVIHDSEGGIWRSTWQLLEERTSSCGHWGVTKSV
jgi:hypothetical protein